MRKCSVPLEGAQTLEKAWFQIVPRVVPYRTPVGCRHGRKDPEDRTFPTSRDASGPRRNNVVILCRTDFQSVCPATDWKSVLHSPIEDLISAQALTVLSSSSKAADRLFEAIRSEGVLILTRRFAGEKARHD